MAKAQKKTGKGRLDKYYKLAKEQGYRARSAFKLIQLNKKYGFLESARCTIDLCAAPGGWLQVASKYMPVNSVIVGVDLVPIKPIPHVVTFAADITTPQCRNLIRSELKDWKADVVLHDGAPNVGTAWVQDAYSQSELVLMSLKLAVEFLIKGGTFVTKVFRSVDYNNLIWVFNQLFGKVEATKPPSSRNVSAEIFVVCRDFLAPKHLDPKFLDPRHVFKDLSADAAADKGTSANNVQANVFHPEKNRRKREGYTDGDYTLFKEMSALDFIKGADPVALLGTSNKITFISDEEKEWLKLDCTTADVMANCNDLKVLGKGDFKALIKWRLALREELGLDVKSKDTEDATEVVQVIEDVDEEQQISEELERINADAAARAKRERRRANEIRTRTIQRMQLQMTAPLDIGLEQGDAALGFGQDDVFTLDPGAAGTHRGGKLLKTLGDEDEHDESDDDAAAAHEEDDDVLGSEEELERKTRMLEDELDGLYDMYQTRLRESDAKYRVQESRKKNAEREEWHGIGEGGGSEEDSDEDSGDGGWDQMERLKEQADHSSDESSDEEREASSSKKRSLEKTTDLRRAKRTRLDPTPVPAADSKATKMWFSQGLFAGVDDAVEDIEDEGQSSEEEEEEESDIEADQASENNEADGDMSEDYEEVPFTDEDVDEDVWDAADDNIDETKRKQLKGKSLDTAEAVTLAQQLVNREKTKTQLINDGFTRYSLNSSEGLPSWFLDDESRHYKPNLPVTKEAIQALRAKQRALDARPIKKVAEAKARKKYKAAQRLEKALTKAEGVNSTTDISEREKAQQIDKLMKKGKAQKIKKDIKLVVAKGPNRGVKGRPKGVKGRYTMVDSRMKKEASIWL
ncbi:FtsJ-domain-containing protein [Pluteus cervinus]|uniref:FtsJ-domain-containing protein n=1 Tax=Pluteus cervinus TaxID=181527 RepID=A0ACD3BGI3_9AGAR|nr:FtsJ-domain-containing protein [Pluteus cervinus]